MGIDSNNVAAFITKSNDEYNNVEEPSVDDADECEVVVDGDAKAKSALSTKKFPTEVAEIEQGRQTAKHDLSMFQLKPPGMKGMTRFNHAINSRQREYSDKPEEHKLEPMYRIDSPSKKRLKRIFSPLILRELQKVTL